MDIPGEYRLNARFVYQQVPTVVCDYGIKQRRAVWSPSLAMKECKDAKTHTFPLNVCERRLISAAELEEIARRTIPLVFLKEKDEPVSVEGVEPFIPAHFLESVSAITGEV